MGDYYRRYALMIDLPALLSCDEDLLSYIEVEKDR
jgi:hypothetical protein